MASISVNFHEMDAAAAQLGAGREEITVKLQQLQQQIEQLVTSGFITERASHRFNESYSAFTNSARTVIGQLTEIQGFLTATAQAIRDLDAQIAAQIQ